MVGALIGLVAVIVLTMATAVFVAAEFSLVAVDRSRLAADAAAGDRSARAVLKAVRQLSLQLSGAQLGITITTLAVGYLARPSVERIVAPQLERTGLPNAASETVVAVFALAFATVLQMVLGELVPKNWAIARPLRVARIVAPLMRAFTTALRPVIVGCNGVANAILRRFGIEPQDELRAGRTPDELASLVRSSARAGSLPEGTADLLGRSLRFADRTAGEVMTARTHVTALHPGATVAVMIEASRSSGRSRFPIEQSAGELDGVDRFVHVKRAFTVPAADRAHRRAATLAEPLPQVPRSLHLGPLLTVLRQAGAQMAAVIDEYGGVAGIVTLEDVVEELVGEVEDEYDPSVAASGERLGRAVVLAGALRLDEVRHLSDFIAPRGPYDTLGGLVMARLGRIAETGDQVDIDDWTLTVTRVDGRRVGELLLTPAEGAP